MKKHLLVSFLVSLLGFLIYVPQASAVTQLELCIGDSLTNGHQAPNPSDSLQAYPHLLAGLLGANSYKQPQTNKYVMPEGWLTQNGSITTVINYGIESQTLDAMSANFSTQVLQNASNYSATTVTLLGGTNNTVTDTGDQIHQKWQDYSALCMANNIRLRIMTLPALRDEPYKSTALAANALLRTNHTFANEFVDLARNTAFTDATNLTYYQTDGVHLTTAANQKIAELILSVRNGTYSAPFITTTSLPNATQNSAYSQTLATTGNPTVWQLKSGTLPNGISFNAATRQFTGTPTQSGSFSGITIWAIDSNGNFDEEVYSLTVNAAAGGRINYALTSQGSTATATTTYTSGGYNGAASNAIDDDRLFAGTNWASDTGGGIYHSFGAPATLEIDFGQSRTIDEVDVVTMRDSFTDKTPVTQSEMFTSYGIRDFSIDYWNGTAWNPLQAVSANNKVWRQFTFAPVTATKIRIVVTSAAATHTRIAELEAWGGAASGGTIAITTPSLANATQGTPYSQLISATGTVTSWELRSGTLPGGITFNPTTHQFEGTATQSGVFNLLVVRANGANGISDEKTYSLTVNAAPGGLVNYALATRGSTITATPAQTYSQNYNGAVINAIDGDRLFANPNWASDGGGGIYHSFCAPAQPTLEINFGQSRTISEIDLVTVRDSFIDKSPVTLTELFSTYGVTGFIIEAWNGTNWSTLQTVSGNNKVWRQFAFTPVTTTKIHVIVTGALATHTRITEIEAWG